jgi:hypothetical protein
MGINWWEGDPFVSTLEPGSPRATGTSRDG